MQLFQWKKYLKHVINQKSICKIYYIATACNTQPCPAFPQQADGLTQNIGQQLLCFRPKQTHRHSTDKHSKTLNSKLTSVKQSVISDTPCRAQTPSSYTKHREQKTPALRARGPAAASPPDVDHAEQLPGQVAQGEGVQPERDRPEQHLWGKPHGKLLRAERGRGGSRQAPWRRRRRVRRREAARGGPAPAAGRWRTPDGWSGPARPWAPAGSKWRRRAAMASARPRPPRPPGGTRARSPPGAGSAPPASA